MWEIKQGDALSVLKTMPEQSVHFKEASRMMYKPFSPARFEKLVDEFLKKEQSILGHKGTEYADNEDRLQNFHLQALLQGVKPSEVALTYLLKHILSIAKAVSTGNQPWVWTTDQGHEGLKQRIADARNYLLLLAACIDEEEGWA